MCASVVSIIRSTQRRQSALLLPLVGVLGLVGCASVTDEADDTTSAGSAVIEAMQDGAPSELPEVVQILVNNEAQDYCTGVLISPRRVLTAAHCMAGATFVVKAPHAPKTNGRVQESRAKKAGSVTRSSNYNEEVWKEDAAILDLDTAIQVATYAAVQDVGALANTTVRGVAVGRSAEARNAPLMKSKELRVSSGNELGYTTGLTSQYYSSGGDSGGPLFLVDPQTGRPTHVVIGIERQPDPPNEFFTRITPAVKRLIATPGPGAP